MTVHEASIHIKRTNPAAELPCRGVYSCAETIEKPNFKRFSDIEKFHRNSIRITVDFWVYATKKIPTENENSWFRIKPFLYLHSNIQGIV